MVLQRFLKVAILLNEGFVINVSLCAKVPFDAGARTSGIEPLFITMAAVRVPGGDCRPRCSSSVTVTGQNMTRRNNPCT